MDPGVRRGDGFKANILRTVIPAQAGTHSTSAESADEKKPETLSGFLN